MFSINNITAKQAVLQMLLSWPGVLAQFSSPLSVLAEGEVESLCVVLSGAILARSVTVLLQIMDNTNEGMLMSISDVAAALSRKGGCHHNFGFLKK